MEAIDTTAEQPRPPEQRLFRPKLVSVVSIAGRRIWTGDAPYIVAEISCNHSGSIEKARRLIAKAKEAGADAVKIQSYLPEELTTPRHKELWALYQKAYTPREWHKELFEHARYLNIPLFSSAFSLDGLKFLVDLGTPAIKIASPEVRDHRLVAAAKETGLPVIMSTGGARHEGDVNSWAIWLHCVAKYPSTLEEANLSAIKTLKRITRVVGLSDHTSGYDTAIAATALGAVMIEKHFKLDDDCIDAAWSLDVPRFAALCQVVRSTWLGMGDGKIRPTCEPRRR